MTTSTRIRGAAMRARLGSQAGYAAVTVLCLMLLLSGTSLVILDAAKSSQNNTRAGREFVQARNTMDTARAVALTELNSGARKPAVISGNGTTTDPAGSFSYSVDASPADIDPAYPADGINPRLIATGVANGRSQTEVFSLRGHFFGSTARDAAGILSYGVSPGPREGQTAYRSDKTLWSAAVNTAADSIYGGSIGTGNEWGLYGGQAQINSLPSTRKAVVYADDATALNYAGTAAHPQERSAFSAYFDTTLLAQSVALVNAGPLACPTHTPATFPIAPYSCSPVSTSLRALTSWAQTTGTTTLVVNGNLTIDNNISVGGGGALHLIVNGRVTFRRNLTETGIPTRTIRNVFVYAPTGSCVTDGVILNMTGSLTCGALNMPFPDTGLAHVVSSSAATVSRALASRPNVTAPRVVYYTERRGFRDAIN